MGEFMRGLGKSAMIALSSFKWVMVAIAVGSIAFIVWRIEAMGRAVTSPLWYLTDKVGLTKPSEPEQPLEEVVPADRLKCGAYDMLSNFAGSKSRSELDQERILKTWLKYSLEHRVNGCEVFFRQMTLVTPGWGRRTYEMGFWKVTKKMNVPNRKFAVVEGIYAKAEVASALLLAKKIVSNPDSRWEASVLIRPDAGWTVGNQRPEEIAAIVATMDEVKFPGSEFRYFKTRKPK